MISETVKAILDAETRANETMAAATEDAKNLVFNAETDADTLRKKTVVDVKAERAKVVERAVSDGNDEYEKIVMLGKKHADALLATSDVTKATEFIKDKVLTAYVHS